MKHPHLLLITANYPYGKGEEFLETEIGYLAQKFDVTIVSLLRDTDNVKQRPLPAGVIVRPEIIKTVPVGGRKTLQWLMLHPLKIVHIVQTLLHECGRLLCRPALLRELLRFITLGMRLDDVLAETFRSQQVAIVYSYWLSVGALSGGMLKRRGIARLAIARAHRGDLYHERSSLGCLPGQSPTIAQLDKVFCISQHGVNYLKEHYPNFQHKIELSRLGVQPAPVRNAPSTNGRLHIVSCAYLTPIKRIHLLVEALVHCEIPTTWTHLGGGKLENEIRMLAAELPESIHWRITGPISNQDVLRFYQENPVDLFINVSASEGLPVSIMEAMSYGIPVIATDVGGSKELVSSGQNGILLPASITPSVMSQTITDFYQLPASQKQEMREAAWQTWCDTVNAEVQYPAFVDHLSSLIQS